jgi:hypothetical protein
MKGLLSYFRDTRIMYKNLSAEWKTKDKKISQKYDNFQLPVKIFINSLFGALSAPQVFPWGDMDKGEMITCTGRQYLRIMIDFFTKRGYSSLVCDTDGVNFSLPEGGVDDRKYIGKGLNWLVKEGKEYIGYDADVAEFNDLYMRGPSGLDCDGTWKSCINLARKNYATLEHNGKVKLTGNSIKSKKMPKYIEIFLDKAIKLLLNGDGQGFVEWYYEYLQRIFDQKIPLIDIANKAKVKQTVDDYIKRSKTTTKAGSLMSRQAHMELAIKESLNVSLGDVIYYVNNGTKASHGDVQKVNKPKKGWNEEQLGLFFINTKLNPETTESVIQLNCYRIDPQELESNPGLTGEYNIQRAIVTFNKRVEPLLVCFKEEVRDNLLVKNPEERPFFTKDQCELINGVPFEDWDQDRLEDVMTISDEEVVFWEKVNISPYHMYKNIDEETEKFYDKSRTFTI